MEQRPLSLSLHSRPFHYPESLVLQVFKFVQNLIGCEEQARLFKEEVRCLLM